MRLPIGYAVVLRSETGEQGVLEDPDHPSIIGGAPPEFGGRDDWWSPEQLLLGAVNLCLMATYRAFAQRERFALEGYTSRAEGTIDKTADGLAFTAIRIHVELVVSADEVSRALAIFDRAKRHCIVTHSLKTPVEATVDVRTTGRDAHV